MSLYDDVVAAIVETLQADDGAGSDLESVGEPEGPEPWLYVVGSIDIGQLANVAIETVGRRRE